MTDFEPNRCLVCGRCGVRIADGRGMCVECVDDFTTWLKLAEKWEVRRSGLYPPSRAARYSPGYSITSADGKQMFAAKKFCRCGETLTPKQNRYCSRACMRKGIWHGSGRSKS